MLLRNILFRKKQKEIYNGQRKDQLFDFDLIKSFFDNQNKISPLQTIGERIILDLDIHKLFEYIDRTTSKIGQQYFYHKILTIDKKNDFSEQEEIISFYSKNSNETEKIKFLLSRLSSKESYFISNLIYDEYSKKPVIWKLIKVMPIISLIVFIAIFFLKNLIILLILIVLFNLLIHYWNKKNIIIYSESLSQLLILCQSVDELKKINIPYKKMDDVNISFGRINKLRNRFHLIKSDPTSEFSLVTALLYSLIEYIKILFLIEPIVIYNILDNLEKKRDDILVLYKYISALDCSLSISHLRNEIEYFCYPKFHDDKTMIEFVDLYHPLIENCVSNSIKLHKKSLLLTGSNMSGKSSFIKSIALNILLGQTINTCFARECYIPKTKIFTSVHIFDDLTKQKSYFLDEVQIIKNMIEESQKQYGNNIFFLDEIFRGTNTIERIAIATAVLSFLSKDNLVIVSTHDIELCNLINNDFALYHFEERVNNNSIIFDYKLKAGQVSTRNAIKILEVSNYPEEVITESYKIIKKIL